MYHSPKSRKVTFSCQLSSFGRAIHEPVLIDRVKGLQPLVITESCEGDTLACHLASYANPAAQVPSARCFYVSEAGM